MSEEIKFEYLIGDKQKFKEATDMVVAIIQYGDDDFVWLADIEKVPEVNGNLIGLRRIIKTPVWTVEDQKAGRLPEVGSLVMAAEVETKNNIFEFAGVCAGSKRFAVKDITDGFLYFYSKEMIAPIESPEEKAQREEDEFVKSEMKNTTLSMEWSCVYERGLRAAYRKLKGGE